MILDLHVHSPYSHGASEYITLYAMVQQASTLGIDVLGTGDCLHPEWLSNIKTTLKIDKDSGLLYIPTYDVKFMLTTEINCIWGKNKQAHILLVIPSDSKVLDQIVKVVELYGNNFQGRPEVALTPKQLYDEIRNISVDTLFIPAHVLTPWFGILGSRVGYASVEEAFDGFDPDALETGLSADIAMVESIAPDFPLVSFGDAHSVKNLGREVTCMGLKEVSYSGIAGLIKHGFVWTYEMPPQLGKYYETGCRNCGVVAEGLNKCPKCNKSIVKGVLARVNDLKVKDLTQYSYYLLPDDSSDKLTPIKGRAGFLYDIKFIPGYDGKFGMIKHDMDAAPRKKLSKKAECRNLF